MRRQYDIGGDFGMVSYESLEKENTLLKQTNIEQYEQIKELSTQCRQLENENERLRKENDDLKLKNIDCNMLKIEKENLLLQKDKEIEEEFENSFERLL